MQRKSRTLSPINSQSEHAFQRRNGRVWLDVSLQGAAGRMSFRRREYRTETEREEAPRETLSIEFYRQSRR